MPILTLSFSGGRYHATPWGAHVNEGQIEWPPSPWRICRALLATGLTRLGWREDDLPSAAFELMGALGSVLPEYELPSPVTVAHTRHYMPIPGNTTKVLDGFAHLGGLPLRVSWAVDLSPDAKALLERLAAALGYLGRAESWVDAAVADGVLSSPNCRPCTSPELGDAEPVTLLAPMPPADFQTWREGQLAAGRETAAAGRARRSRGSATTLVPDDIVACMLRSTDDLQRQGWNLPPGSRRVLYARPRDSLVAAQPSRQRPLHLARQPVECALVALTSYAVRGEVLPNLELAVRQAEQLHAALANRLDALPGRPSCPELTGQRDDRGPLQDGHRHAHYIPLCLRRPGVIDHILIYAPMKLAEHAQAALDRLRWVHSAARGDDDDERRRLTTTLAAVGSRADIVRDIFAGRDHPDLLASATEWVSHTPFVAPRFVKAKHPVEAQILAELRSRGLPDAVDIEAEQHADFLPFLRRRRRDRPQPPNTRPWLVRLRFAEPVSGPIALGYASHFGLGLFRPLV